MKRLLKLFISLFYYTISFIISNLCKLTKIPFPGTFVVLHYHSVKDSQRSLFSKHLRFLNKSGCAVRPDYEGPLQTYQRYISVTFDDGYQNFLRNVVPEIQKSRIPTAVFIPTGNLGKKPEWATDSKYDFINETILTEEQLQHLPHDLIIIGSHSVSHPHLTDLSKELVLKELLNSKKKLEEILHNEIDLFALPFGSYNPEILLLAKRIGYKRVFLHIPIFPPSTLTDFLIGRIEIAPNDWPIEYQLKILGAYQWLPVACFIKRSFFKFIGHKKIRM